MQNINLTIKDREFIVLVGPSGCGKSTTLRLIAGLETVSSGEIYIDGVLANDLAPKERDIAMVFQEYALYPQMTVYENIAFPLKLQKISRNELDCKVRETAKILGLEDYLDCKPKSLSGGQQQRVAIGRAIVRNPKILLMDEPLSNLDTKLRNQMRAEIIRLRERIRATFVYVTHDQTEALTLGDRIAVMRNGIIQQVDTPQMVFEHPVNLFVACFIGIPQMNCFRDAELILNDNTYSVSIMGKTFTLPKAQQSSLRKNKEKARTVIAGVRPNHIAIERAGIAASVELSEMMGSEKHIHMKAKGTDVVAVVPTSSSNIKDFSTNRQVHFTMEPESILLFDKTSEEALF